MSKINGKALVILSMSPYEIILQDENGGMPGGQLFKITPLVMGPEPCLIVEELVPKELK